MSLKKIFIVLCVISVSISSVFADTFKNLKDTNEDGYVIWKLKLVCDYDIKRVKSLLEIPEIEEPIEKFVTKFGMNSGKLTDINDTYKNGEFKSQRQSINEEKIAYLPAINYLFFRYPRSMIRLPSFAYCDVPEKTRFIYAGTWEIVINPGNFDIEEINYIDEYDEAKEWLLDQLKTQRRNFGEVELVRGEMKFIKSEESD